jgi:hypothetical protein
MTQANTGPGLSADETRKLIVDQKLGDKDKCPGRCGGTLHLQTKPFRWLQCSQNPDHGAAPAA